MGLIAKLAGREPAPGSFRSALEPWYDAFEVPTWSALDRGVHRRPVTDVFVGLEELAGDSGIGRLRRLQRLYPSVGVILFCSPPVDARALFEVGRRCGRLPVIVRGVDDTSRRILMALGEASPNRTATRVLSALRGRIPPSEATVVRSAIEWSHRQWDAVRLAGAFGYSRPFLSERLKREGLPSIGRLQLWARLFHAATWLADPGRSAESVSVQLEYADGSGFRRALRGCTGQTPTELMEAGGVSRVLELFLGECGDLEESDTRRGWVA